MPCCELLVSLYREHMGYVQCQSSLDEGAAPEAEGFMPRPRGHADNRSRVTMWAPLHVSASVASCFLDGVRNQAVCKIKAEVYRLRAKL